MTKTISIKKQKFLNFSFKQHFSKMLFSSIIFFLMLLIIMNPDIFSSSTIKGLKLFFYSVLPGLLPFMFLTKMLTELEIIFKITKKFSKFTKIFFGTSGLSLYCFFMSILSGYPIGAKIIYDLHSKKLISDNEAKKMSVFCTTSGPVFIIGAVGVGMLNSFKLGTIIYIAHILSSLICGIIYNIFTKRKFIPEIQTNTFSSTSKPMNIFSFCLSETINSLFLVGGYITIFYLLSETLDLLNIFILLSNILTPTSKLLHIQNDQIKGVLYGIIEVTRGAKELSLLNTIPTETICAIISFSGISIIMQSLAFLKPAKIKAHSFIFSKCVHCVLSFFICKLLIIIL